jgi:hypothetical protein
MASELIKLEKDWIRPLRPIRRKNVGTVISYYATAELDMYINPKLIKEILAGFGLGPDGETIHKIIMSDRKELYVIDAALDVLTA